VTRISYWNPSCSYDNGVNDLNEGLNSVMSVFVSKKNAKLRKSASTSQSQEQKKRKKETGNTVQYRTGFHVCTSIMRR